MNNQDYYVDEKCTIRTRTFFKAANDTEAKQMVQAGDFTDHQVGECEYLVETLDSMTKEQNQGYDVQELYNQDTWQAINITIKKQPRQRESTSNYKFLEWSFFEDFQYYVCYQIIYYSDDSKEILIQSCWVQPWMWYTEIPDGGFEAYEERLKEYLEKHLLTLHN